MFEPADYSTFRFTERSLSGREIRLGYALDDGAHFVEELTLPVGVADTDVEGLLDLLHWVAGVSYYKTAAPPEIAYETGVPGTATAAYLEALYSEGLGEFAVGQRGSTSGRGRASRQRARDRARLRPAPSRRCLRPRRRRQGLDPSALGDPCGAPVASSSLFTVRVPAADGAHRRGRGRPAAARRSPVAAGGAAGRARLGRRAQRPHPDHRDHLVASRC